MTTAVCSAALGCCLCDIRRHGCIELHIVIIPTDCSIGPVHPGLKLLLLVWETCTQSECGGVATVHCARTTAVSCIHGVEVMRSLQYLPGCHVLNRP